MVCRSLPVLRHRNRLSHTLFTDTLLHDHRLDLRPATFHRSRDRAHAARPEGVGLLHSFQRGGRGRLCLSLCPSYLSTVVARACGGGRRRAGPGNPRALPLLSLSSVYLVTPLV